MEIVQCYQVKNRCYIKGQKATQRGILVHSTGAVNRELRRYVDYPERLGKNQYGNHWNTDKSSKCMHAFIGYDKDQKIIVAQTLPYDMACWGCGKGKNGSYNYDPTAHIQFEICEGARTDSDYYWKAIAVAEQYCAHLCLRFGWTAEDIVGHKEAAARGYAGNHADPDSWMGCFGDSMDAFRARVQRLIDGGQVEAPPEKPPETPSARPSLHKGDRGEPVKYLQSLLNAAGYPLPMFGADGIFGDETHGVLMRFQGAHGLAPDGVCGADTWAALERVPEPEQPITDTYTVVIPGVDAATATHLVECYPSAVVHEVSGEVVAHGQK